jgi:hypothetical protein
MATRPCSDYSSPVSPTAIHPLPARGERAPVREEQAQHERPTTRARGEGCGVLHTFSLRGRRWSDEGGPDEGEVDYFHPLVVPATLAWAAPLKVRNIEAFLSIFYSCDIVFFESIPFSGE